MSDLFSYAQAQQLRDQGIARAADRDPPFADAAYAALVDLAKRQPTIHVDDFLKAFPRRPDSPNAMGSIWLRAIRNKVIERSGRVAPCKTEAQKHVHQYPIYTSLLYRGALGTIMTAG